jgi:hypothetical protein
MVLTLLIAVRGEECAKRHAIEYLQLSAFAAVIKRAAAHFETALGKLRNPIAALNIRYLPWRRPCSRLNVPYRRIATWYC